MPKLSAGIMLYREQSKGIELFLVHPGGPFWAKKDAGAWSIAKGEYQPDDDALAAAKREFFEETGTQVPAGPEVELGMVKYSNKELTAWAVKGSVDARRIHSNTFTMEWPPRTGRKQDFPEVDRAGWFDTSTAMQKLVPGQVPLVERLIAQLQLDMPAIPEQTTLL